MFLGLYMTQSGPMLCKIVMVLYIRFVRCHRDDACHSHASHKRCLPASRKSTLYKNITSCSQCNIDDHKMNVNIMNM